MTRQNTRTLSVPALPDPPSPPACKHPSWMDAGEAAELLGCTAHTLRRLAREGKSPAVVRRVGGRWRWSRADIESFVRGDASSAA